MTLLLTSDNFRDNLDRRALLNSVAAHAVLNFASKCPQFQLFAASFASKDFLTAQNELLVLLLMMRDLDPDLFNSITTDKLTEDQQQLYYEARGFLKASQYEVSPVASFERLLEEQPRLTKSYQHIIEQDPEDKTQTIRLGQHIHELEQNGKTVLKYVGAGDVNLGVFPIENDQLPKVIGVCKEGVSKSYQEDSALDNFYSMEPADWLQTLMAGSKTYNLSAYETDSARHYQVQSELLCLMYVMELLDDKIFEGEDYKPLSLNFQQCYFIARGYLFMADYFVEDDLDLDEIHEMLESDKKRMKKELKDAKIREKARMVGWSLHQQDSLALG